MEQNLQQVEAKREAQDKAFQNQGDDPASQLQGLMTAQASLKRMTSGFSSKPSEEKVKEVARKPGVYLPHDLVPLGPNEANQQAPHGWASGGGRG